MDVHKIGSPQRVKGAGPAKATPRTDPEPPVQIPRLERYARGSSVKDVAFADVLDWTEAKLEASMPPSGAPRKQALNNLNHVRTLRPFWATLKGSDVRVDRVRIEAWKTFRTNQHSSRAKTPVKISEASAWTAAAQLKAFTNGFAAEHGLAGRIEWRLPTRGSGEVDWYERDDVARLLWALRGRVWDAARGGWRVGADGKRVIDEDWLLNTGHRRKWDALSKRWTTRVLTRKELRRLPLHPRRANVHGWTGRFILTLVYSGSTGACAKNLRWKGAADGGESFVDLEKTIAGRVGHLYRLGPDEPAKNMAGLPVAMCKRLRGHMRRWRQSDAADGFGFAYMLHPAGEDPLNMLDPAEPLNALSDYVLKRLWKRAGLEAGGHHFAKLADTAVVWALRAGGRRVGRKEFIRPYKAPPSIMRSAAMMVGSDYASFRTKYESVAPGFMRKQLDALYKPARGIA